MPHTNSLNFILFTGRRGFAELAPDWARLAQTSASHFLHLPVWYEAELDNRSHCEDVIFAAGYRQGELCIVVPLVRTHLSKGRVSMPILELFYPNEMGVNDVLDGHRQGNWLPALTAALRAQLPYFWLIRWQCVPASGCAQRLQDPNNVRYSHASKYLDISAGAEVFWQGYSKKFSKGLRKKNTKAEQLGALQLQCVTDAEALPAAFEQFLEVEGSGWKGEQGTSIRQQPNKLSYYHKLLAGTSALGVCQINLLYLDSLVIAAHFAIVLDKTLYLLKIGFREDYGAISPGYLILERLINRFAGSGDVSRISFVTGVGWIDRWHPQADPVGTSYSGNGTLAGALALKVVAKLLRNKPAQSTPGTANEEEDE